MSASTSVAKILISFDEYVRLKELEKKYEELKAQHEQHKGITCYLIWFSVAHVPVIDNYSFNFLNIFFLSDEDPGTLETPTHANNVTIPHQSGSGFGLDNISLNQIASIVAEKLKPTSTQLPDFRPLVSSCVYIILLWNSIYYTWNTGCSSWLCFLISTGEKRL